MRLQRYFTGDNCGTDINECATNPCQNEGKCAESRTTQRWDLALQCTCANGYSGQDCDQCTGSGKFVDTTTVTLQGSAERLDFNDRGDRSSWQSKTYTGNSFSVALSGWTHTPTTTRATCATSTATARRSWASSRLARDISTRCTSTARATAATTRSLSAGSQGNVLWFLGTPRARRASPSPIATGASRSCSPARAGRRSRGCRSNR